MRQLCASAATGLEKLLGRDHTQTVRARNLLEQWRGTPPAAPTAQVDDGRERVALLETLDVAGERKHAALDALVAALRERGVAALVAPLAQNDALRRDRTWDAVIGVADLDGGTRFAHRANIRLFAAR